MFKLVILNRYDPLSKMPDKEFELDTDFATSSAAELRALRWLLYRPNDYVMLIELETGVCMHCGVSIEEQLGWVRHKWVHIGGYYSCLSNGGTQAEPA